MEYLWQSISVFGYIVTDDCAIRVARYETGAALAGTEEWACHTPRNNIERAECVTHLTASDSTKASVAYSVCDLLFFM